MCGMFSQPAGGGGYLFQGQGKGNSVRGEGGREETQTGLWHCMDGEK